MDSSLKQRLIGAAVLVALAVIFLPMLLKGPDLREPDAAQVPLSMPATPSGEYETRELPLTVPEGTSSPGGVLGMTPAEPEPIPPPVVDDADVLSPSEAAAAAAEPAAAVVEAPVPPKPQPPVASTPAVPAAAVAAGNYVVNIGSFGNSSNAAALATRLRAQKLPVLSDQVTLATGKATRIRVGPYADRATAEAARLRAEEVTGSAGKVVAIDAPASALAASDASAAPPPPKPMPTTAPKPAPPAAASANAAGVGFAVQLSAPSVEADAIALRDKARAHGFSAFVQPVDTDGGRRYRVRVGPVADRSAAAALRDEVNGKLGSKGIIVANP